MTTIEPHEAPDDVGTELIPAVQYVAPEYIIDPALRHRFRILFAMGLVGLALMGWFMFRATLRNNEIESLRHRNEVLVETVAAQQVLIDKLATELDEARAQGADVETPEQVAADVPDAEVSPIQGVPGERGDAGPPGSSGESGLPGESGTVGATGATGEQGARGLPGADGSSGAGGADGAPGVMGLPGPAGVDGVDGVAGADGTDGAAGAPGADGAPGAPGPQGPPPSSFTFSIGAVTYTCTPTSPGGTTYNCEANP